MTFLVVFKLFEVFSACSEKLLTSIVVSVSFVDRLECDSAARYIMLAAWTLQNFNSRN